MSDILQWLRWNSLVGGSTAELLRLLRVHARTLTRLDVE
jgi:hypothetical protein